MLTIAVVGALGAWFAMTAIVQYPNPVGRRLRKHDPIGHLLPGWNFFAPKPIQGDFAVFYRSWAATFDGLGEVVETSSTDWRELEGIERRRLTDGAVNPGRYTRKSIFSCCMAIVKAMKRLGHETATTDLPPDAVMMSLPYLLLTEKVTDRCRDSVAVQFRIDVIGYNNGRAQSHTAFRSAVHRVAALSAPEYPCGSTLIPIRRSASPSGCARSDNSSVYWS
jgi:hypothetical protein